MSTLKVTNIQSNGAGFNDVVSFQNSSGTQNGTLCRTWVNFNGTGVVAIRASFNVSSITDNGTGDYTVNFAAAMADANYSFVGSANQGSRFANADVAAVGPRRDTSGFATGSIRFDVGPISSTSGLASDALECSVAIFR
jgi:hypothetical protein